MPQDAIEKLRIAERRHQKLTRRSRRPLSPKPIGFCWWGSADQSPRPTCLPWLSLRKLGIAARRGKACHVTDSGSVAIKSDTWQRNCPTSWLLDQARLDQDHIAEREQAWLDELAEEQDS